MAVTTDSEALQSEAAIALLKGMADGGTTCNWATVEKSTRSCSRPMLCKQK